MISKNLFGGCILFPKKSFLLGDKLSWANLYGGGANNQIMSKGGSFTNAFSSNLNFANLKMVGYSLEDKALTIL